MKYKVYILHQKVVTNVDMDMDIKLCENMGIFIKNYKSTIPGSNKVVYRPF